MTGAELKATWAPVLNSLDAHFARIPDDVDGLDRTLWEGNFETPTGAKDEASLTLRGLMAHCVVAAHAVPVAMTSGTGFGAVKDAAGELAPLAPSALLAALRECGPRTLALIDGLDEAALAETRALPFGDLTVADALSRALLHLVHHKGQLALHMRLLGLRPTAFLL